MVSMIPDLSVMTISALPSLPFNCTVTYCDWMNVGVSGGDGESDTDFPDSLDLVSSWPNLKISIEADPIIISVNLEWVGGQNYLESKH